MAEMNGDAVGQLVQEIFAQAEGPKKLLEYLLNQAMTAEVAKHVAAEPHERAEQRRGHRNGYKPRTLNTRVGLLAFQVPQVRMCEPYHPSMFAKWQRSERALLVACSEMYVQGVSTRAVREVLGAMCDGEISSTTVSRVVAELDEKLDEFRGRRLEETEYPYVHIDARYEKVRVAGHVVSQAVLVAAGITIGGRREILDWCVGDSESEATWGEMFRRLKDRGLTGLRLLTSDAHKGIVAAMRRHFQGVSWQRCRVHFKREMGRKVSYKAMKELMADLVVVFAPEERIECLRRGEEMAARWEGRYAGVAGMLREGLEDCLAVLAYPEHHRRRLRSTNMMENLMKRLKKRSRVVGVFPNRSSCDRLLGAQLIEVHETWSLEEKAYLNMENVKLPEVRGVN
jgi:putative transposase